MNVQIVPWIVALCLGWWGAESARAADTASPHAIKTAETESAQNGSGADAKPAKRIKSKTARSRRLPFFLRKVDLFPSHRQ